MKITLDQINESSHQQFVELLGSVFEHSPWVAARAWGTRPFASVKSLHMAMMNVVRESRVEAIIDLIRSHPDLGTRLAIGEYSTKEQQGAGLDQLTPEEYERLVQLNETYVKSYGFPFILAVRDKTKEDILVAMEARIWNTTSEETEQALIEIEKITGFRLNDLIIQ